jgi:hypothetical protein
MVIQIIAARDPHATALHLDLARACVDALGLAPAQDFRVGRKAVELRAHHESPERKPGVVVPFVFLLFFVSQRGCSNEFGPAH